MTSITAPVASAITTASKSSSKLAKFGLVGLVAAAAIGIGVAVKAIKAHKSDDPTEQTTQTPSKPEQDSQIPSTDPVPDTSAEDEIKIEAETELDVEIENVEMTNPSAFIAPMSIIKMERESDRVIAETDSEFRADTVGNVILADLDTIKKRLHGQVKIDRILNDRGEFEKNRALLISAREEMVKVIGRIEEHNQVSFEATVRLHKAMNDMYQATSLPAWAVLAITRTMLRELPDNLRQTCIDKMKWTKTLPVLCNRKAAIPENVVDGETAIAKFVEAIDRFEDARHIYLLEDNDKEG